MIYIILAAVAVLIAWWKGTKATISEARHNYSRVPDQVAQWIEPVQQAAASYGVPFRIAMAVLWVESGGGPGRVGGAGEIGLFQLKEIAVRDLGLQGYGSFDGWDRHPEDNIKAGVAFLLLQYKRTGNWIDALGAYNQGQAGAKRYPERAAAYVQKVNDKMKFFE